MHVYYRTLAGGRARAINVNIGCFVIIFYQKSGKVRKKKAAESNDSTALSACLEGLEPPVSWFVAKHSIRLSYRHTP